MRFADRFALAAAPLILRLLLAVTFLWAGLGKILTDTTLSPTQAATLAEMGIAVSANPPEPPATNPDDQQPRFVVPDPETGADTQDGEHDATPDEPDENDTRAVPEEIEDARSSVEEIALRTVSFGPPTTPTTQGAAPHTARPMNFPEGGTVKSVHRLSLLLHHAGNPGLDDESNPIRPIWPETLSKGAWPPTLAWAAAVSEVLFALTLLVGLLTRLSAFAIACVMGNAMWLTVIGPAIQSGDTLLGFLPNHDVFDAAAWKTFAWQLSLFASALALVCTGSGAVGFDRLMFRPGTASQRDDDDPVQYAQDVTPPRGPFDRSVDDS
ncbi:MAG: DoxX family protein [Phycisphaerales bacterium JB040]